MTGRANLLRRAKVVSETAVWNVAVMGEYQGTRITRYSPLLVCAAIVLLFKVASVLVAHDSETGSGRGTTPRPSLQKAYPVWNLSSSAAYIPCAEPSAPHHPPASPPTGYLVIETSGGLNQERSGMSDAVAVARLLNATLLIPLLDAHSAWDDPSAFADVFDHPHFIRHLAPDVTVVSALPPSVTGRGQGIQRRVPRKSTPAYYLNHILPLLRQKGVVRLTKFDFRLAASLPAPLQKLRCRALYQALRFTAPIRQAGEEAVQKLRAGGGAYVAIHLRFEEDMLAFSQCDYGGGEEERARFKAIRARWPNLKDVDPSEERRKGKCPLTPTEVGRLLRAMGYPPTTPLYVASGKVHGGEGAFQGLRALYPMLHTKDTLGVGEGVGNFSSRLAAVDYLVCLDSDVFVANNRGNMARLLAGHRRFTGHRVTIRPNMRRLGALLTAQPGWEDEDAVGRIRAAQEGWMGAVLESSTKGGGFYENPRACICEAGGSGEHLPADGYGERRKM